METSSPVVGAARTGARRAVAPGDGGRRVRVVLLTVVAVLSVPMAAYAVCANMFDLVPAALMTDVVKPVYPWFNDWFLIAAPVLAAASSLPACAGDGDAYARWRRGIVAPLAVGAVLCAASGVIRALFVIIARRTYTASQSKPFVGTEPSSRAADAYHMLMSCVEIMGAAVTVTCALLLAVAALRSRSLAAHDGGMTTGGAVGAVANASFAMTCVAAAAKGAHGLSMLLLEIREIARNGSVVDSLSGHGVYGYRLVTSTTDPLQRIAVYGQFVDGSLRPVAFLLVCAGGPLAMTALAVGGRLGRRWRRLARLCAVVTAGCAVAAVCQGLYAALFAIRVQYPYLEVTDIHSLNGNSNTAMWTDAMDAAYGTAAAWYRTVRMSFTGVMLAAWAALLACALAAAVAHRRVWLSREVS
ncbi:hypothetical protein [Bifidobacterium platyrrhinorum]|uniref:Uncharacterized protein n=1 Tax=Bifidobacterium platyrrhinorum TaxID=2661628 RepID=A0A6L9SU46_9BIFI|nr:hypothetical protein [Bifidobacterium platyrrhinorum]NEG55072.1 hypothetical protein [Bifidobacterium platyrrhinorum]